MENEKSTTSKALGQPARVPSIEAQHAPGKLGGRPQTKARMVDHGLYPDQQHGKQPLVNDDDDVTFSNYIQRAKHKLIRSLTNIGPRRERISNPAPAVANAPVANNTKDYDQNDHFTNFIKRARKKLRTVSRVGKNNGSFKRG